jgi:starch-binding outer membrane protein, SusD/RagB family
MKKLKIYSILIIFTMLVALSCSDDFVDKKPIAMETEETFYSDFSKLDYTATAAYGILATRDLEYTYIIAYNSASDDIEVGGANTSDWVQWQNIDRLIHTPSEARVFNEPYGYYYKGIRMTNEFLQRVDDVVAIDPSADPELVAQRVAEMKFLRAFYHFMLLQTFGGVPICDHTIDPTEFAKPRNTIAEVLHFVESDLEAAIPNLKEKSEIAPDYGRATKGAARSLLTKALLYESSYAENYTGDDRFTGCENKYNLALLYADSVIASNEYSLVGIDGERFDTWRGNTGGFRYLFTTSGDNSSEGIFEIQNVNDGRDWTYSRGSYLTIYTTVRYYTNPARGTADRAAGGWSFILPTHYMIDAFGNQDSRETGLNSAAANPLLDPRFATTIGCSDVITVNGVDYTKEWDTVQVNDLDDGLGWYPMSFSNLPTGTIGRKYECSDAEYWGNRQSDNNGPLNVRYIRYADVLLMAAEAAFKTNDQAKALQYVNMVRERARMSGETGYPEALTAISFNDIVHERRLELACEPFRYFDLVRWKLAEKYIDGITLAALGEGFTVDFVPGKHEFYPLPTIEIQLSDNALVQYPGWQ